jgi:hypothetical protein
MKSKIPTLVALIVLLLSTGSVVFAVKEFQSFTSSAAISSSPIDLKITNIKDSSFTVSWLTEKPSIGFVEYQNSTGQKFQSIPTQNSTAHWVTLTNLNPSSIYSFRVNSNGDFFDNNNTMWTIQTLPSQVANTNNFISGKVFNKNNLPAANAIVYVDTGTQTFSSQASISGNWILSLPSLPDNSLLNILIESSTKDLATAKVEFEDANPVPFITLGNAYDFRNATNEKINEEDIPQIELQLPE